MLHLKHKPLTFLPLLKEFSNSYLLEHPILFRENEKVLNQFSCGTYLMGIEKERESEENGQFLFLIFLDFSRI